MAVEWKKILTEVDIIDEDDMVSDLDTKVPTQQSVKAYVDGKATGIDDVARDNIVILAWKLAIAESLSVFNLEDGVVDGFEDETGIDTASSTNEEYNETDDYYSPSSVEIDNMEYADDDAAQAAYVTSCIGVDIYSKSFTSTTSGWADYHCRKVMGAANIENKSTTMVRVGFTASASGPLKISLAYIGRRDGTTYNMLTTGQQKVKLQVAGSDVLTVDAGTTKYTDWVPFITDGTEDLIVSYDLHSSANYVALATFTSGDSLKWWSATDGAAQDSAPAGGTLATSDNSVAKLQLLSAFVLSESTIKTQGSYSLKGIATTDALNKTLTRTIGSPIDLSGVDTIILYSYSLRTGSNIKIGIHDSGGTTTEITPNITDANTWQKVTWDISGVSDADKDAIDSIIITIVNADSANTFYIDAFAKLPKNMTLISNKIEAEAEPTTARFLALVEAVDAYTVNTDIKAYISNDDGSNYDQVTLTDEGYFDSVKKILAGNVTLTDRDDKTMRQKITTHNNKNLKVHAWGMLWR